MRKTAAIKINCSDAVKNILSEALKNYTDLSTLADHALTKIERNQILFDLTYFRQNFSPDNSTPDLIDNCLHDYCHEAINQHYDQVQQKLNARFDEQRKLMLNMLEGTPTHDKHLDCAIQKDNII